MSEIHYRPERANGPSQIEANAGTPVSNGSTSDSDSGNSDDEADVLGSSTPVCDVNIVGIVGVAGVDCAVRLFNVCLRSDTNIHSKIHSFIHSNIYILIYTLIYLIYTL